MSLDLIKITSLFILAFLIGCSSGDNGEPTTVVVVAADNAGNDDSTGNTNADTGGVSGADTDAGTGSENTDASDSTSTAGESDTNTAGADTTSGNEDAGADAGTDSTAGSTTDGTATTTGTTDVSDTDAGTDGVDDTTTGSVTSGTTDDSGTTTDGTTTNTAGTTSGTDTDSGMDTAGTDTGATDGETTGTTAGDTAGTTTADDGTTAGSDTDGTGTTTSGMPDYPNGSLAFVLSNDSDLSLAFEAIQNANLDLAIDDPMNAFTLFLPTNEAIEALNSPSDFDLQRHTASGAVSSATLAAFDGRVLNMDDGQALVVEGGGTAEPLTIAGVEVISADITGNASTSVVHVIDAVLGDSTSSSPYPAGSLADVLFNRGDMSNVLEALKADGLDLALNDLSLEWTLFLPNDTALDDPADFSSQVHIYTLAVNDSLFLTDISGLPLLMNSGDFFDIGGGGTEELTIGGATIVEVDVQNEDGDGMIVHIIDDVLVPE